MQNNVPNADNHPTLDFDIFDIEKIQNLTRVANPEDYPPIDKSIYNRATWPLDIPCHTIEILKHIYGPDVFYCDTSYSAGGYDMYIDVKMSSAMHFKGVEIRKFLAQNKKSEFDNHNILWADVQIQRNYIKKFDAIINTAMAKYSKDPATQEKIANAAEKLKNQDIFSAMKYKVQGWDGTINPWKNLEFLERGAHSYNEKTGPQGGISPESIANARSKQLSQKAKELDDTAKKQIQASKKQILASLAKKKTELGIPTPEMIEDTVKKEVSEFNETVSNAMAILETTDIKKAQQFAFHYLYKGK